MSEILDAWVLMMAAAALIAAVAAPLPRRPLGSWLGDFFIRWGLAGLLVWFVVHGIWAVRELLGQKYVIPFAPIEGYLEHATVWGAVLTGTATFIFLGAALFLRAIFEKEPQHAVYYIRWAALSDAEAAAVQAFYVNKSINKRQINKHGRVPIQREKKKS